MENEYDVEITSTAEDDLDSILNYISSELCVPETAVSILNTIILEIKALKKYPERFPLINNFILKQKGYRYFPVGNYLVFYQIDKNNSRVLIMRVLYGKSNYLEII